MNRTSVRCTLCTVLFAALFSLTAPHAAADQFTTPTPEELSMTSQPQVPGAAAVYLFREETMEDDMHDFTIYVRLKVLTDRGKEYGNVELSYASSNNGFSFTISNISARTIHADGTIVPFTGKPYEKLVEKTKGVKVMAKVFSMPDVSVGSILEYRYQLRYDDNYYIPPEWYIQSDLYTRKAHYHWKPTTRLLGDDKGLVSTIAWMPVLPVGAEIQQTRQPGTAMHPDQLIFDLNIHDVPPIPDEDHMPPIASLSYRVLFYYTAYRNVDDYWKSAGKDWAKARDKFIGPGPSVGAAVKDLTSPADTQDQKLRKIYAAVMKLENTDFTRERSTAEEKASGLKDIHNTDDVLDRKRGSSDQLTELFVAMARAAGMKAYLVTVTNRDRRIFVRGYLTFYQFDDYLAIVNVDGKEQYFDPGARYCPYGHLAWKHTMVGGLRQNDGASELVAATPGESYKDSRVTRIGDLTMDPTGLVTGTVKMTFVGAPALRWRQQSLTGDSTSLNNDLRESVERLMPGGMEVNVVSIERLDDYEQPLVVTFNIKGGIGSSTGKRILLPANLFEVNSKATFPHEKRTIPVYFEYPYTVQDAVRIIFPPNLSIESLPANDKIQYQTQALYSVSTLSAANSVIVRRNYMLGEFIFPAKDYPDLRAFYSKMETKDQESVVLTTAPVAAKPTPAGN